MNIPLDLFPNGIKNLDVRLLSSVQKNWLGDCIKFGHITPQNLNKITSIKLRTLQRYGQMRADGCQMIRSGPGQPKAYEDEDIEELKKFVADDGVCKNDFQINQKVEELYRNRAKHVKNRLRTRVMCSSKTIRVTFKKASIRRGRAEVLTTARKIAIADKWNTVSFAAMNHLMSRVTERDLVLNMDSTQFRVGRVSDGSIEVSFVKEQRSNKKALKVDEPGQQSDGSMAFYIKYYLLMSAGGFTSDPIYVVADDKMKADEIDISMSMTSIPSFLAFGNH